MALLPGDLGRERLGGDEQHLLLLGEVRDREPDVGEEGAGEQRHLLARDQLVGERHGVRGLAAVVAREHLERPAAEHAARGVDLLDRELPALLVGQREARETRVAVDLADLDGLRRRGRERQRRCHEGGGKQAATVEHGSPPLVQRRPSSPLISEALRPPARAWMRPPVVIARISTISSGRGASATPTSIASKWLRT